jgi:hypothetical protein
MLPAEFHKAQSARFKLDFKALNFLPTSPPPNLDFLFVAQLSTLIRKLRVVALRCRDPFVSWIKRFLGVSISIQLEFVWEEFASNSHPGRMFHPAGVTTRKCANCSVREVTAMLVRCQNHSGRVFQRRRSSARLWEQLREHVEVRSKATHGKRPYEQEPRKESFRGWRREGGNACRRRGLESGCSHRKDF